MEPSKAFRPSPSPKWLSITGDTIHFPPPSFLGACRALLDYQLLDPLGEGTYGVVHKARQLNGGSRIVALKQLRTDAEDRVNGIPITILREISILRSLNHPNIINMLDVAVGEEWEDIYMVMEYAEQEIAIMIDEGVSFQLSQVKCLAEQLLSGLEFLHRNSVIHRDIKTQNLLLTAAGVLKIVDFGMARLYSSRPMTVGVTTIWYRSPELLLGSNNYTSSVDVWSAGLVVAELLLSEALLMGETSVAQLALIVKVLGTPTTDDLASLSHIGCTDLVHWERDDMASGRPDNLNRRFSSCGLGLATEPTVKFLRGMLTWDPKSRWTASEALGRSRTAREWWEGHPKACSNQMLANSLKNRSISTADGGQAEEKVARIERDDHGKNNMEYVFDFDDQAFARSAKRSRKD